MSDPQHLVDQAMLAPQHLVFASNDSGSTLKTDLEIQELQNLSY